MKTMAHPQLDLLELHILDRLTESEAEWVEEHLLVCDCCRTMRSGLDEQIQLLRQALRESRN